MSLAFMDVKGGLLTRSLKITTIDTKQRYPRRHKQDKG